MDSHPYSPFISYSCRLLHILDIHVWNLTSSFFLFQLVNEQPKIWNTYAILVLVYGHVDILWTYQGAKIKMMSLAWLCRYNVLIKFYNILPIIYQFVFSTSNFSLLMCTIKICYWLAKCIKDIFVWLLNKRIYIFNCFIFVQFYSLLTGRPLAITLLLLLF